VRRAAAIRRCIGFAETRLVGAEFEAVPPLVEEVIAALGQETSGHHLAHPRRLREPCVSVG